jgi:hypothetical protein
MGRNKIVPVTILILLFSLAAVNIRAQDLIFQKQPDSVQVHPNFGPNRRHFYHAFLSSSLIMPAFAVSTILTDQPYTGEVALGFRYKLKVARPIAIVSECGISRNLFRISQSVGKSFPDTLIHQSQSIRFLGLFGGAFLRFRLGQRGDYLGKYIDIGLTAQASAINQLVTKDFLHPTGSGSYLTEKTTVSKLSNINPLTYHASARVGFNRISLVASYRLSRLIDDSTVQDLPDLEIGIEISPVRY